MRSFLITILLASLALVLGSLAWVQLRDHDLTSIFGDPPRQKDEALFIFEPTSISGLYLSNSSGGEARFDMKLGMWVMEAPTHDRADFRYLQSLVLTSRHLMIEEILPEGSLDDAQSGLETNFHEIKIIDSKYKEVAHYRLGRQTPWHRATGEEGKFAETFYIQPMGKFADGHIYVCACANTRVVLDTGFNTLRDHRPFLFDARTLADIQIRSKTGDIVLARTDVFSPWRITKPLDLGTDPDAVARLVLGLYEIHSPKIHEPSAITIPPRTTAEPFMEISLGRFDKHGKVQAKKITLEVEPPASPEATITYAKVTGRTAIFELPLSPTKGLLSLTELPVAVNDLRSRTLLSKVPPGLRSFTITSPGSPNPLVFTLNQNAQGTQRWIFTQEGKRALANKSSIDRLFYALHADTVNGFVSDAPTDLAPYGLNPPAKTLVLAYGKDQSIVIDFGQSSDGTCFALRRDESGVVEIDPGTYQNVATQPAVWRDSLLWSMPVHTITGFTIQRPNKAPLKLGYNFLTEEWSAAQNGKNISALLNKQRANILLNHLEALYVTRWLGPRHAEASSQLLAPALTITVHHKVENEEGTAIGMDHRILDLTPVSYAINNALYYGRVSGDQDYFYLSKAIYDHLNVQLVDQ